MSKKIATTVYLTEEQLRKLKELNYRTKVPVAEYIRQGVDRILLKYKEHLPGQLELNLLPQKSATTFKH